MFYNILEEKKPFSAIKTRFSKREKKEDFSKGAYPWFWSKNWTYFDLFFLSNIGKKNVCYDILERKNPFLGNKKKFKKSKKLRFSKEVNQWFWSKNGHFSMVFLKYNISQENVFYDILKRKNAFLGYKNKKFKKSKN